jgi:hypothetical protein
MQLPKDDVMLLSVSRFRLLVEACHSLSPSPSIPEKIPRILRKTLALATVGGLITTRYYPQDGPIFDILYTVYRHP